ncbi:unnamed protein product [Mycena citricolor]|uniref:Uncharacterized protein n=1 Tax=Mycena citricolor TaxID=2018698 RepID=A0AAD2HXY9_9AGAR|nr:unnamed protein product [Mycena citricolor]CAK5284271.1 unnamed protein product [Mycena citricolor]
MTTHAHSLPSFAQAFSNTELPLGGILSGSNALPPIHPRSTPPHPRRPISPPMSSSSRHSHHMDEDKVNGRKRPRDHGSHTRDESIEDEREPPRLVRIKQEHDTNMPDADARHLCQPDPAVGSPAPSASRAPVSKKRRMTVTGAPQLNTDVRASPPEPSASTPISPVVMGFSLMRDNPNAIEQVRSMITVKQKQKALIEQRRGSLVGASTSPPTPVLTDVAKSSGPRQRRSPANGNTSRRVMNTNATPPMVRVPSPPTHSPSLAAPPVATHSLPPPPISFARRRAEQLGNVKRKPADIIISPREAHTPEEFQPAIQSAPPVPGRFSMALPRLPSVMGLGGDQGPGRRIAGYVPPTPTRLSMQRHSSANAVPSIAHIAATPTTNMSNTRSPSMAASVPIATNVPIATTLAVPRTPATLSQRHPADRDKEAFLAPFEMFYDALSDARTLKGWLGEQLARAGTLTQTLTKEREAFTVEREGMESRLADMVEAAVDKRVRVEVAGLYRRIDELESALRSAGLAIPSGSGRRMSTEGAKNKYANGLVPTESYTFPPRQNTDRPVRRNVSPGWPQPAEDDGSTSGSPAPPSFDSRRLSLSASRLDPLPGKGVNSPPLGKETKDMDAGACAEAPED